MGNDGGSVPVRCEQVKLKKRVKVVDNTEKNRAKWLTCCLTHESFYEKQVLCDRLGNLYEKHSVLKTMVEKSLPPSYQHLKGLKDLISIQFTKNPDYQSNEEIQAGALMEKFVSPFACPITNRPVNGKTNAILTCGHVFSAKGLDGIESQDGVAKECYLCQKKYTDDDVLILNPTDEERQAMIEKLAIYQKNEKEKKRKSKPKDSSMSNESQSKESHEGPPKQLKKRKVENNNNSNSSKASLVQGGLSVKSALKTAKEGHDASKKGDETYQSIFTKPEQKSAGIYMTGIYLK